MNGIKLILTVFAFCLIFFSQEQHLQASDKHRLADAVLACAEDFFLDLKEKRYEDVWASLSGKSRSTIINDVYRASAKDISDINKEDVIMDFDNRGVIFSSYWNSFISNFDPDIILEESVWELGRINYDEAEIVMRHRDSDSPTRLRMFNEGGKWKIGLVETFWTRKYLKLFDLVFR